MNAISTLICRSDSCISYNDSFFKEIDWLIESRILSIDLGLHLQLMRRNSISVGIALMKSISGSSLMRSSKQHSYCAA